MDVKYARPRDWPILFKLVLLIPIIFLLLLAVVSIVGSESKPEWTPPSGKTLVWSDEFEGTTINTLNWNYQIGGTQNNGSVYFTDNGQSGPNAYVSDGVLVIKAMKQNMGGKPYTSAYLSTEGKKDWKYGTIVAKLKLPYGQGIWPSFWMLGNDVSSVGFPKCGEIDIAEMYGGLGGGNGDVDGDGVVDGKGDYRVWANTHYGESIKTDVAWSYAKLFPTPLWQEWHYYQLDWDPSLIKIKVDGEEYYQKNISNLTYFQKPFFIILCLNVGGDWPGLPDNSTVFPQYLYADWVRVYQ